MSVASRLLAVELPEVKMFQTRFVNQLLYSRLDACELGVRDETTRVLVRKEWTFMTNSESSQNFEHALQSSQQARLAERNTLSHLPCETCCRAVQQILKMERWILVATRFATSHVDTSFDRGSREFE